MKRSWIAAGAMVLGSLVLVACSEAAPSAYEPTGSAAPQAPEQDGRIVFVRGDSDEGEPVTYTVNPSSQLVPRLHVARSSSRT